MLGKSIAMGKPTEWWERNATGLRGAPNTAGLPESTDFRRSVAVHRLTPPSPNIGKPARQVTSSGLSHPESTSPQIGNMRPRKGGVSRAETMQTFIFGLLLACISGVTVLAFRHPIGFSRLFPYLLGVATAVFTGASVWHVAIQVTWANLLPYMVPEKVGQAIDAIAQLRVPYHWVALSYLGVVVFLWIILKLPPFLQMAEEDGTQSDGRNASRKKGL